MLGELLTHFTQRFAGVWGRWDWLWTFKPWWWPPGPSTKDQVPPVARSSLHSSIPRLPRLASRSHSSAPRASLVIAAVPMSTFHLPEPQVVICERERVGDTRLRWLEGAEVHTCRGQNRHRRLQSPRGTSESVPGSGCKRTGYGEGRTLGGPGGWGSCGSHQQRRASQYRLPM